MVFNFWAGVVFVFLGLVSSIGATVASVGKGCTDSAVTLAKTKFEDSDIESLKEPTKEFFESINKLGKESYGEFFKIYKELFEKLASSSSKDR